MMFDDGKSEKSDYNEAAMQIYRLHGLWEKANIIAQRGDMFPWLFVQDRIWIELSADAKRQKKREEYIRQNAILRDKITKAAGKMDLYVALNNRDEFLKQLQDDVGKGAKRTEEYDHM